MAELKITNETCFLTNHHHPWDEYLDNRIEDIENNQMGRLGTKHEEEDYLSEITHHKIVLSEDEVQDLYLENLGLHRYRIIPDGNCLFRAVAKALFGTQDSHIQLRKHAVEHITENICDFLSFFEIGGSESDVLDYAFQEIERLKLDHTWGGFESIMAMSSMYNIEFHLVMGGNDSNESVTIHKYKFPSDNQESDLKKLFLVWMSYGHYDLALDTIERPIETEFWFANLKHKSKKSEPEVVYSANEEGETVKILDE